MNVHKIAEELATKDAQVTGPRSVSNLRE
jgi:hypothetical protein